MLGARASCLEWRSGSGSRRQLRRPASWERRHPACNEARAKPAPNNPCGFPSSSRLAALIAGRMPALPALPALRLCLKSLKSHQRQWVDFSDPTYTEGSP